MLQGAQEKAHKRWRVHMYTRNTRAIWDSAVQVAGECGPRRVTLRG